MTYVVGFVAGVLFSGAGLTVLWLGSRGGRPQPPPAAPRSAYRTARIADQGAPDGWTGEELVEAFAEIRALPEAE